MKKLSRAGQYAFEPISNENIVKNESSILTFMTWISLRLLFVTQRLEIDKTHKKVLKMKYEMVNHTWVKSQCSVDRSILLASSSSVVTS